MLDSIADSTAVAEPFKQLFRQLYPVVGLTIRTLRCPSLNRIFERCTFHPIPRPAHYSASYSSWKLCRWWRPSRLWWSWRGCREVEELECRQRTSTRCLPGQTSSRAVSCRAPLALLCSWLLSEGSWRSLPIWFGRRPSIGERTIPAQLGDKIFSSKLTSL